MRRRLLIITKEPEFDARDEVVLGQCEPFTSGWSLKLIDGEGKIDSLLVGTYTDLRRIQESCALVEEPAAVRRRVEELRKLLTAGVTETIAVNFANRSNTSSFSESATVEMRAVPYGDVIPTHTPGGLMNLEPSGNVLIATVVQPERADDTVYLGKELQTLLSCKTRAVIVDLGRVPALSANAFKELAGMRDQLREISIGFVLCNVANALQHNLAKVPEPLSVFTTQASALAVLNR